LLVVNVKLSSGQRLTRRHLFIMGSTALWLMGLAFIVRVSLNQLSAPPGGNPRGEQWLAATDEGSQAGQRFTTPHKANLLLDRMAASRPYLLGTEGFYMALAGAYVLVLGVFLVRAAQTILREQVKDT
jgi:hypothetical protein